jgi:hypothetical protein
MTHGEQGERAGLTMAPGCADAVCGGAVGVVLAVALYDAANTIFTVTYGDDGWDFLWSATSKRGTRVNQINKVGPLPKLSVVGSIPIARSSLRCFAASAGKPTQILQGCLP